MGKITFRRVLSGFTKVNGFLPVVGGVAFLIGSIFFWPDLSLQGPISTGDWGASFFVAGSVLYLIAPTADFFDMSFSLDDITTNELPIKQPVGESKPLLYDFEGLYKAQMLRTQRANTMLYAVSGVCFTIGSFFFFPAQKAESTHGAWLYLMGCVISFLGAFLAATTARESKKTRQPYSLPRSDGVLTLWWWDDEDAQVVSCCLYMFGDLIYAIGSVCFFPKIFETNIGVLVEGDYIADYVAVVFFIIGSVAFISGASIDVLALLRASSASGKAAREGKNLPPPPTHDIPC